MGKFIFKRPGDGMYAIYLREDNLFLGRVDKYSFIQGGYRWAAENEHGQLSGHKHRTRNEAAEHLWEVNSACLRKQLDKANSRICQLEQALMLARHAPVVDIRHLPPFGVAKSQIKFCR